MISTVVVAHWTSFIVSPVNGAFFDKFEPSNGGPRGNDLHENRFVMLNPFIIQPAQICILNVSHACFSCLHHGQGFESSTLLNNHAWHVGMIIIDYFLLYYMRTAYISYQLK